MNYSDIHHCIETLQASPRWFFQKEKVSEKLQCLEMIQQFGAPYHIYSIIHLLKSDNILLQNKAAETVICLFKKMKSLNEYATNLKHLPIEREDLDAYRVDFDESIYLELLGIASFNKSGYIREKAVREIGRLKNIQGIRYILFRPGDWVEAVRKTATESLFIFLEEENINELIKLLPEIDWLLDVERVDLKPVHNRVIEFITNRELSGDFLQHINRLDDKIRLRFYKNLLGCKQLTKPEIYKILADRSFLIRHEILKYSKALDPAFQKDILSKLLEDRSAVVRLNALYGSKAFNNEFGEKIIDLLSDESASIRALCRYLLKDKGMDFAQLYRQRIASKLFLSGSIQGLSETGTPDDLPLFEKYIHSERSRLVAGSLIGINKLNPDLAKRYSLALLTHQSKKLRGKAVEILAKNCDNPTLEKIREIYSQSNIEIKKTILSLYSNVGGWNIFSDLLLSISEEEDSIRKLGWQLLERWKDKATRLFTSPAKAETDKAKRIYDSLDVDKLGLSQNRKELLRELMMYLN
jgi:hypothetical protein